MLNISEKFKEFFQLTSTNGTSIPSSTRYRRSESDWIKAKMEKKIPIMIKDIFSFSMMSYLEDHVHAQCQPWHSKPPKVRGAGVIDDPLHPRKLVANSLCSNAFNVISSTSLVNICVHDFLILVNMSWANRNSMNLASKL